MKAFLKEDRHSFLFLNITQFLGALNDNIYKLLVVFLLINIKGADFANIILSTAGAIFVIPFLLFSAAAGVLADRLSKRNILVSMKLAEFIIMALSVLAIFLKSEIGVYILLFLMAFQSTIFGPSKYGIIPEIVKKEEVSKANGILTSLTYLAIIIGTFLAAFVTDITNKNFVLAAQVCVIIAFVGFLTSFNIKRTPPRGSKKRINPLFFLEIYRTLKLSYMRKFLLPSIFASSFFLFIGGFVQLNTIPFAMQSLGLSEVGGGYLFLSTAIGIAIGALLAGKISKEKVELGISCICGFLISFFLIILSIFPNNLYFAISILILLGIFGGIFLIPFDAFIQIRSPEKRRGQVIAASGFLSFLGVLLAALLLFVISEILGLSAAGGFFLLGIIVFVFNFINTGRLSELFIPYFVKHFLNHLFEMKIDEPPQKTSLIVIENSWARALTLFSKVDNLKIIVIGKKFINFPFYNSMSESLFIIPLKKNPITKIKSILEDLKKKDVTVCFFFKDKPNYKNIRESFPEFDFVLALKTKKEMVKRKFLFLIIQKTIYRAIFEKVPRLEEKIEKD